MLRVLIPYTLWWVRIWYRIFHGITHWFLRILPMPASLRHHLAGAVALVPYLLPVWLTAIGVGPPWPAYAIAAALTAPMLLIMHRVEVAHAGQRR